MNTQIMQYLHVLPRELSPLSANTTKIIDFVLAQYSRLFNLSYFSGAKTSGCQWSILQRVFTMGTTRCIMFVAAKIMDSFLDGTLLEKSSEYSYLIDRVELETCSSTEDPTYYEASTRLIDTMELAFIKTRVRSQFDTFQLLRSMAPVFLKIVALDSSLWPSQHKFSVSLAHVLASDRRELEHFVLLDMLYAMTHGLPQAIIYDTSVPAFTTQIVPFCGFPVELQIVLADINARCAQGYAAHDWRRLEKRIFAWEPPVCAAVDEDGWKISAQLAIHESWRHTMLIYLYMAICGVASDDPRVQSSVKQVFQLISSTKGPNRVPIDPHFFIQYIVAGACARSEKQRAMARNQLVDLVESRSWFWRGSDFIPLLDHLWHGAAINGRPIRWSDYIASRQATLPVGT
ncbi:hypothetical protein BDV93DRAFT_542989 [Ceratobasidium sp. AG-I]|nr:hypothetical protein BDV93DRAFT_542989 [Ceratobasidium sp. AG-I]